ncbi:MAG TPA: invasion associated locus B family protein [Amaricoccus sp.]|mgnify:FL=1|uniref:invasion associated locus B family protein n=1 Tax=Amaricoccus sp. TaxID=1872485 RepID=UPI002D156654|nr:invasion associated locus B family protein [Amaricoccus sp.]HMQ92982.1 invasion associated locus B family protein [Amaricoccus sp.]HMR52430.1 invasion associated locus B family protein [Amaricoccus sp.]HMR61160.1 invasion associated locus B family protein [Amaricoccus sp.]HMT99351.1 invasion associated locus B family protein [Amaricoccus sp.]
MQLTGNRFAVAAAIAIISASMALAQEAATTEPAGEAPATEAAPAGQPAAEAPAGEAQGGEAPAEGAEAAPGAGDPAAQEVLEIVRDTFGDWQVRCAPDGNDCFMYQLAMDPEQNPVAEISLLKLPAGGEAAAGATVVTPLGTLLPPGLDLQIDSGEVRKYPFAWCSQVGCFARFGLSTASVEAMKRGNSGKMTLVSVGAPQSPLTLAVSLNGFTKAYDSLEVPAAPEPAPAAN